MADKSAIEWTDATWTPIRARYFEIQSDGSGKERIGWHCEHASEGCRNCYAETFNRRLGTGLAFKPGELFREEKRGYNNGEVKLFLDEAMLTAPLRWKKPRMIFVCSMTDLFADFVPDEWIDKVFAVMALAPQHSFQVLTKRAKRMREYVTAYRGPNAFPTKAWPLPNVWLGVSAERQQEADERIPELLATPAAIRFVSAEPLLGPIDFTPKADQTYQLLSEWYGPDGFDPTGSQPRLDRMRGWFPKLDWIIVGGESGQGARPMHPAWARSIRDQCAAAGVPLFFKQWGAWAPGNWAFGLDDHLHFFPDDERVPVKGLADPDRAQGRMIWSEDDKTPEGRGFLNVGKKAAGRLLDGIEHNAMPEMREVPFR